jgi:hypothetical protein
MKRITRLGRTRAELGFLLSSPPGLLALGSTRSPRLPGFRQWHLAGAVPDYSGGPATAFDRFPFPARGRAGGQEADF